MCKKTSIRVKKWVLILLTFLIYLLFNTIAVAENAEYQFYSQLLDFQKQIYNYILNAPHESSTHTLNIEENLSAYSEEEISNRIADAFSACKRDNPEQTSWLSSASMESYNVSTNQIVLSMTKQAFFSEEDIQKTDYILDCIEAKAVPSWDRYTKAYYIASTIVSCLDYDIDYMFYQDESKPLVEKQHLLSILNGVAVCEGYAELFKAIANRIGLPCTIVSSDGHAFIHILMEDGKWYGHDPQNELQLQGQSMYQGEQTESGWINIYEINDAVFHYLLQPIRTEEDYQPLNPDPILEIEDISSLRKELNTGSPCFLYSINDDGTTCTITGYEGKQEGNLIIPDTIDQYTVTSIGNSAFAYCRLFDGTLSIPDTVETIGACAFAHCSGLKGNIALPDNLKTIGNAAFLFCTGFDGHIIFNNRLEEISASAFADCQNITGDLMFPDSVRMIGYCAFDTCNNLTGTVHIPSSLEVWDSSCLSRCDNLTAFDVNVSDPRYSVYDGILYNKNMTTLIQCIKGKQGDVIIPEGVTRIGDEAFNDCKKITSVSLPSSLREIGSWAFGGMTGKRRGDCILPTGVEKIGQYAFHNSNFAGTIYYPAIDNVGADAFGWNLYANRVVIPEGVTNIPDFCFSVITLQEAYIPESVTNIGIDAFEPACSLKIYGVSGSYAETFAQKNPNYTFVSVQDPIWQDEIEYLLDVNGIMYPDSIALTAHYQISGEPVNYISWISSNTKVAEVDNGVVTAKTGGHAVIEATTDEGVKTTWTINCSLVPDTLHVSTEKETMFIGEKASLNEWYEPFGWALFANDINPFMCTYESSDSTIIKITGNTMHARSAGIAVITCKNSVGMSASVMVAVIPRKTDSGGILYLPDALTTIGPQAFMGVAADTVVIPKSVTRIDDTAFLGSYITTIVGSTEYVEQYANVHHMIFQEQ